MDGHTFTSSMDRISCRPDRRTTYRIQRFLGGEMDGNWSWEFTLSCTQFYSDRSFTSAPLVRLHESRLLETATHCTSICDWTVQQVQLLCYAAKRKFSHEANQFQRNGEWSPILREQGEIFSTFGRQQWIFWFGHLCRARASFRAYTRFFLNSQTRLRDTGQMCLISTPFLSPFPAILKFVT
jgi:hypothetical protein